MVNRNESLEVLASMDCLRDPTTLVRLELVEVAHLAEEKVLCAWEMPLHEIIKVFHESHAMFRIFVSPALLVLVRSSLF